MLKFMLNRREYVESSLNLKLPDCMLVESMPLLAGGLGLS